MEEVYEGLYVGAEGSCARVGGEFAVVHACKHPCHQRGVGYSGDLDPDHPEYLVADRDTDLYLNLVDMPRKLDHGYTEPIVSSALEFVDDHISDRPVLIHCNEGLSRSPSLAMLYLAKRVGAVSDRSYQDAKADFSELYPAYSPGRGIHLYLEDWWDELG